MHGAKVMADYIDDREDHIAFVMDEGMARTKGLIPGLEPEASVLLLAA